MIVDIIMVTLKTYSVGVLWNCLVVHVVPPGYVSDAKLTRFSSKLLRYFNLETHPVIVIN